MPKNHTTEEQIAGTTQQSVNQQFNTVEEGVDDAIDKTKDTVHEFRQEAQDIVDQWLNHFKGLWQEQRPKVEQYVATHPWLVMGGLLVIGYLLGGSRERGRAFRP